MPRLVGEIAAPEPSLLLAHRLRDAMRRAPGFKSLLSILASSREHFDPSGPLLAMRSHFSRAGWLCIFSVGLVLLCAVVGADGESTESVGAVGSIPAACDQEKGDGAADAYNNVNMQESEYVWPPSLSEESPVMSHEEFVENSESFACCAIHGSTPLDQTLKHFLTWPRGFFVEAGAYDGLTQSNTAIFERHFGWRGILVEPSASQIDSILYNRPHSVVVQAALGNFSAARQIKWIKDPGGEPTGSAGDASLQACASAGSSLIDGRGGHDCNVRVLALSEMLDGLGVKEEDVREKHFWSIDVEGNELEVLHGVDFSRHRPRFLLLELTDWEMNLGPHVNGSLGQPRDRVFGFMHSVGYWLVNASARDAFGSMSGWPHYTSHRDFLFAPRESPVHERILRQL